jgi:hypothetical protein
LILFDDFECLKLFGLVIKHFEDFSKSSIIYRLNDLIPIGNVIAYLILIKLTKLYAIITHRHRPSPPSDHFRIPYAQSLNFQTISFASFRSMGSSYLSHFWASFCCCSTSFYSYVPLFFLENRCFYTILFLWSRKWSIILHNVPKFRSSSDQDDSALLFYC